MINSETHKLLPILEEDRLLELFLEGGKVFLLKGFDPIDPTIYNENGGWCADVISMESDPKNKFHRPGSGVDFYEADVLRIVDPNTGVALYEKSS